MIMQHKLISIALLAFICASQCEKVSSTVRFEFVLIKLLASFNKFNFS
jgi:hypothetical protein